MKNATGSNAWRGTGLPHGSERYSFQIYRNLGFRVASRDAEKIAFVWERNGEV